LQSKTFQTLAGPLLDNGPELLAWRSGEDQLVVVNFTSAPAYLRPSDELPADAVLLASTDPSRRPGDVRLDRFVLLSREAALLGLAAR
jgi:hypothetical protein